MYHSVDKPVVVRNEGREDVWGGRRSKHVATFLPFLVAGGLCQPLDIGDPICANGIGIVRSLSDFERDRHCLNVL